MAYFQQLFEFDDQFRELTDDQRREQRMLQSRPVLLAFKAWMDEQLIETLPATATDSYA